jgi:FKBP-type peptidyl-prolyl cis-trans isomerase (trigger factor)
MADQFNVGKMIDNPEIYKLLAPMASSRIKPSLLLQKFIESNKITADDNAALLAWIRKEYNVEHEKSDEDLQKEIQQNLDNLKYAYIENQAIATLLQQATITEKNISYKELSQ